MNVNATPRIARLTPYQAMAGDAVAEVSREIAQRTYKPGELIVKMQPGTTLADTLHLQVLESYHFDQAASLENNTSWMRVKLPEGVDTATGLAALRHDPSIAHAELNATFHLDEPEKKELSADQLAALQARPCEGNSPNEGNTPREGNVPNDLDFRQWAMSNNGRRNGKAGADISATKAWEISVGSKNGPLIAVIDTGIDYKHKDLAANMWVNPGEIPGDGIDNDGNGVIDDVHGYNAFADNGDPMDGHSHGTHCAGVIGAVGDNNRGVAGINWDANLMAIKIFDDSGDTSLDAILRGLQYAARMNVDITNNSWGDSQPSQALKEAFQAMDHTVHFAAAGNNSNNNDYRQYYPVGHDLPNMVGVAASDRRDYRPNFSNYGKRTVELAAPGDEIISTVAGNGYMIYSGTSMATPHAAGVAGLILSEFPTASTTEVRDRLIYNSDYVPALIDTSYSKGRINAAKSLEIDKIAPAAATDFEVTRSDSKEITLQWTTTGDDGMQGGAPSDVEVWMSTQPITVDNLDKAQRLDTERPKTSGEKVTLHVPTGHSEEDREYHFAMRFVDNVGQRSDLAGAQAHVPATQEIYRNAFGPDDGFTGEGQWARVPREGTEDDWMWTDSPNGKYRNGSNWSLVSPSIDLAGYKNCRLSLDARYDIWKKDSAVVEVSADGEHWSDVGSYHGRQNFWNDRNFDLSEFDGQKVQVRVRMHADVRDNRDGIYVDNFRVIGDRL